MSHDLPDALLEDRFTGCLLGLAVGDALGVPFEGCEPERIAELFPSPDSVAMHAQSAWNDRPGQYSDDTQMMRCIVESIVANAGVVPEDIAARFVTLWETGVIGAGDACSTAVDNLRRGVDWRESGAPVGQAGNGSAMRTAPLGLWFHDDPAGLIEHTRNVSLITHHDDRSTAGALTISVAVAYLVSQDRRERFKIPDFVEHLHDRIAPFHAAFGDELGNLAKRLDLSPQQALREIRRVGHSSDKHNPWPGLSGYVVPSVLGALDAFLRSPRDFRQSLWQVLSYGGDVDTTGAMTGALSGAFNGLSAIPPEWTHQVHDGGRHGYAYLRECAIKLFTLKTVKRAANA